MSELRDLYDVNRNLVGKTIKKGDIVPYGLYYLVVVVFIQNDLGKFLIQKRSLEKGGKWATTDGHPKAGESSIDGIITEVKEEIGIDLDKTKLKLFKTVHDEDCFCDLYYINMEVDLSHIKLQKEEVSDIMWFSKEEIDNLIENNEFHKTHVLMYRDCLEYLKRRS